MKTSWRSELEKLPLDKLEAHIKLAQEIFSARQTKETSLTAFLSEMREKAKALGFSLEEIIHHEKASSKNTNQKSSGEKLPSENLRTRFVPVKYRDTSNPEYTWTGRGIKPRWLRDKIASGANIEDFLVK